MKTILSILTLFFVLSQGSFAADVATNVGKIQASSEYSGSVPSGGEQKGFIGKVLSDIFWATGLIKNEFITAFQTIEGNFTNNIPKWDGNKFVEGSMYDVSGNIGVGTSTISSGLKLDVAGKIGATEYCDEDGESCFRTTSFPAQWYQANNQQCSTFCESQGLENIGDTSNYGAMCTSGEVRYAGVTNISYPYGTWGGVDRVASSSVGNKCYIPGQRRDNDGTDTTTGCFCSGGIQVGANQISGFSSPWAEVGNNIYRGGGNVGIGINSPNSPLHIDGSSSHLRITRNGINKVLLGDISSGNNGQLHLYNAAGSIGAVINSGAKSYLLGGDVGIGTSSPTMRLDVNGKIRMRNQTAAGDSADIVTTKGYVDSKTSGALGNDNKIQVISQRIYEGANSGLPKYIDCNSGYTALACSVYKSENEDDEDVPSCRPILNQCEIKIDQDTNWDGDFTGTCTCARNDAVQYISK